MIYIFKILIPDNNTVLRAFSNCYYWLKNEFLDIESRNLGFYSDLQTDLSNYFRGEVINFVLNEENKKYINDNLSKYLNSSIEQFVKDISQKNSFINNSIFEISILSKI